jgi:hypothetical protein
MDVRVRQADGEPVVFCAVRRLSCSSFPAKEVRSVNADSIAAVLILAGVVLLVYVIQKFTTPKPQP